MYDIIILGAGPIGLYAGFYAGLRGMNGIILESSDKAGGQLNLYKEKFIYDIPGFSEITAGNLLDNIYNQYKNYQNQIPLNLKEDVKSIVKEEDGSFTLVTNTGTYQTKTILVTTGSGRFIPRKLGLENEDKIKNIKYAITNMNYYKDKSVALFGGGDSAVDWAKMLNSVASSVYLIHRRDEFRAHEHSVEELKASSVNITTPFVATKLTENNDLIDITLENVNTKESKVINVQEIVVNFGTIPSGLGPLADLKLELSNGVIKRNSNATSNVPGIFSAGNAGDYLGKVKTLACGFGEVPVAINSIVSYLYPDKNTPFVYSSMKK